MLIKFLKRKNLFRIHSAREKGLSKAFHGHILDLWKSIFDRSFCYSVSKLNSNFCDFLLDSICDKILSASLNMKWKAFVLNEEHAKNFSTNSTYSKQNSNQKDLGKAEERHDGNNFY